MGKNKGKKHKKNVTEDLHDYEEIEYFTPELKNSKKSDKSENDAFSKPDNFKTNIFNLNKSNNFDSIVEQIDKVIKSNDNEYLKKTNYFESLDIALKVLNDIR